jgi:hypothetical protein
VNEKNVAYSSHVLLKRDHSQVLDLSSLVFQQVDLFPHFKLLIYPNKKVASYRSAIAGSMMSSWPSQVIHLAGAKTKIGS